MYSYTQCLVFISLLFSISIVNNVKCEESFLTPKAYLLGYWDKETRSDLPMASFLIEKASPLNAIESAKYAKLASNQISLSRNLQSFCKSANLFCFTGSLSYVDAAGHKKYNHRGVKNDDSPLFTDAAGPKKYNHRSIKNDDSPLFTDAAGHKKYNHRRIKDDDSPLFTNAAGHKKYNHRAIKDDDSPLFTDAAGHKKYNHRGIKDDDSPLFTDAAGHKKYNHRGVKDDDSPLFTDAAGHKKYNHRGVKNDDSLLFTDAAGHKKYNHRAIKNDDSPLFTDAAGHKKYNHRGVKNDDSPLFTDAAGHKKYNHRGVRNDDSPLFTDAAGHKKYNHRGVENDDSPLFTNAAGHKKYNHRGVKNDDSTLFTDAAGHKKYNHRGVKNDDSPLFTDAAGHKKYNHRGVKNGDSSLFTDAAGHKKYNHRGVENDDSPLFTDAAGHKKYNHRAVKNDDSPTSSLQNSKLTKHGKEGNFFRETMLTKGNIMPMPDIRDSLPNRSFLPRSIVSKIPFSSSKIDELKLLFHADADSPMERILSKAISECEETPNSGETRRCVGSIEDMIDFAASILGKSIEVKTTENSAGSKKDIMIGSVRGINGGNVTKSVSCHISMYPYLLYYCHYVPKVRIYEAEIMDPTTNAKINHGIAICHVDTSTWNPEHEAFLSLGSGPGKIEVCHWIYENNMSWTIADAI